MLRQIRRLLQWGRGHDVIIGLILSSLFINILALAFPLALLQVYDRIIPNYAIDTLIYLSLIITGAVIFELLLRIARAYVAAWADACFEYHTDSKALGAVLGTGLEHFNKEGAGTHMERLSALSQFKDFYGGQALISLVDLPFVLVYIGLIGYIHPSMIWVPLIMLGLFFLGALTLGNRLQTAMQMRRDTDERRFNFIIGILTGIRTIKTSGIESFMTRRYERLQSHSAICDYELSVKSAASTAMANFITQANMIAIVSVGSLLVIESQLSVGELAALTLLSNRSLQPLSKLMGLWRRLQSIVVAQRQMDSIAQLPQENAEDAQAVDSLAGKIQLDSVTLKNDEGAIVLDDVSLNIMPGEIIAITGNHSAGKTQLLHSIVGFHRPEAGQITIDDRPISYYQLSSLRQHIAYMTETPIIFDGTILENITMFGDTEKSKRALEIATQLGLDKAIFHLPLGFNTHIGNRAVDILPVGLRQRIAIARELLKDPDIILFDEANHALDFHSDELLRQTLLSHKGKTTMIIISHRPSTIKLADRIFTVENQKLVERHYDNDHNQRRA